MKKFFLLGPPGSWRHRIAKEVYDRFGVPRISPIDILMRYQEDPRVSSHFSRNSLVEKIFSPEIVDIVYEEIVRLHGMDTPSVVFDGFPLTTEQMGFTPILIDSDDKGEAIFCFFRISHGSAISRLERSIAETIKTDVLEDDPVVLHHELDLFFENQDRILDWIRINGYPLRIVDSETDFNRTFSQFMVEVGK